MFENYFVEMHPAADYRQLNPATSLSDSVMTSLVASLPHYDSAYLPHESSTSMDIIHDYPFGHGDYWSNTYKNGSTPIKEIEGRNQE